MWMSFINETFKIVYSFLRGEKATLKTRNGHRTFRQKNGQKAVKACDQVFFWHWDSRSRQIDQEVLATIGSDEYSEHPVQSWVTHFQSDETHCEDLLRPGRPLTDLVESLRLFLQDYPLPRGSMLS
jgi:predicted RNA-binding protein with PUA-like domain